MDIQKSLNRILKSKNFTKIICSNPIFKNGEVKINGHLYASKGSTYLQLETLFTDNKVKHQNLVIDSMHLSDSVVTLIEIICRFKQTVIYSDAGQFQILCNKKGNVTVKDCIDYDVLDNNEHLVVLEHDRHKQKFIEEGTAIPFLVELGVMDGQGRVFKKKRNKFNQINNFLQYVDSIYSYLEEYDTINVLDLCCGKSYLSFAIYYYFDIIKKKSINIVGVDLKTDVVEACNSLADKSGMTGLRFVCGDIMDYIPSEEIHMVVSLHACDVATDIVLSKAVKLGTKVILSSPCCHHELASQIDNQEFTSILRYGILKQRLSEILTDTIRALALEASGYMCDVIEFIDIKDTPKNLLIKAIRISERVDDKKKAEVKVLCDKFNLSPSIMKLLGML